MEKIFLDNYFSMSPYELDIHHYRDFDFYSARNIVNGNETFFTKAILFKIKDGTIEPLIYFSDNRIFNKNRILFEDNVKARNFNGWQIEFSDRKQGFSTAVYTNVSRRVTEGPIFVWKNNQFVRYVVKKRAN